MLGGGSADDQVVRVLHLLTHNVVDLKLPGGLLEPLHVVVDVVLHYVKPSEGDIRPVGEKCGHPGHVSTRGIQ